MNDFLPKIWKSIGPICAMDLARPHLWEAPSAKVWAWGRNKDGQLGVGDYRCYGLRTKGGCIDQWSDRNRNERILSNRARTRKTWFGNTGAKRSRVLIGSKLLRGPFHSKGVGNIQIWWFLATHAALVHFCWPTVPVPCWNAGAWPFQGSYTASGSLSGALGGGLFGSRVKEGGWGSWTWWHRYMCFHATKLRFSIAFGF